jgi:hypothetical protein
MFSLILINLGVGNISQQTHFLKQNNDLLIKNTKNTYLHIVFNNVGIEQLVFLPILFVNEKSKEIMKNILGDCVVNW